MLFFGITGAAPVYLLGLKRYCQLSQYLKIQKQFVKGQNNMLPKTELEKQKSGEEFWNSDAELSAVKSAARALCDQYNLCLLYTSPSPRD